MRKAILSAMAGLSAGVFALVIVGGALAASPTPSPATKAEQAEPPITKLSGVVGTAKDADGDVVYLVGTTRVSVGPAWFWGSANPLAALVGKKVSLTGSTDLGPPATESKATTPTTMERVPEFDVQTVNGKTVREPGRPAWAGGPNVVGAKHPGSTE